MKSKYFPYPHLIAALLCLAVAAILNLYGVLVHPKADKLQRQISEKIDLALRKALRDMNRVKPYLSGDTVNFHDLFLNKTYFPTYIYKNGQTVFWTDHTIVSEGLPETFTPGPKAVETRFGKFLVSGTVHGPYQIQVFVPLEKQFGIKNKFLYPGLNREIFGNQKLDLVLSSAPGLQDIAYQGQYLFSVQPQEEQASQSVSNAALGLIFLGLLFLIWGLIRISRGFLRQGYFFQSSVLLFLPLLGIRLVLLYYNFPFSVLELDAFDPKLYAASFWSPSIGDLVLNGILILVFTTHVNQVFRRRKISRVLQHQGPTSRFLIRVGCAVGFYLLLLSLYHFYYSCFTNSRLVMDITQSLQFSVYKGLLYTALVLHTIIFLIIAHLLIQVFYYVHGEENNLMWFVGLVVVGLVLMLCGSMMDKPAVFLLGVSLIFYLAILFSRFKKNISTNPFQNYLFTFWIIGISSLTGSLAVYEHFLHQLLGEKQKFAENLLMDRDTYGELLLTDITRQIQEDQSIQTLIKSPFTNNEFIQQKILRQHLPEYFDKYEATVRLFEGADSTARMVGNNYSLREYEINYLKEADSTGLPDLFLIKDHIRPYSRKYIKLFQVNGQGAPGATIALELSLKKMTPYSVVPELLQDQEYAQPFYGRAFSIAIYRNGVLQYNEGDFEYIHNFSRQVLSDPLLYAQGLGEAGYHHLGVQGTEGKTAVVSTPQYSLADIASNFSFLFLLHTFLFLIYMLAYLVFGTGIRQALNTNFSTKIQFFLNFGILIPLLVVSVATASLVTGSYKKDLQDTYVKRGRMVQENILNSWSWASYHTNKEALREEVMAIADLSEVDINLYDNHGRLITSSQPLIFEAGLLSRYMNPEAYADIRENNAQRILLKEQTGDISFNALYIPLPSVHNTTEVEGFIGIPFFDSEKELDSKLIQLLTTIMNIFTAMFLVFIVVSNWASRALTVPLKLVTAKLKQTTLTGQNEKLEYHSADEIGLLVNEYNLMLEKLEASKRDLANQEKEAAWREMARQVAHEIKNPLTPMKLSLQYLQKAIAEKRENMESLISKISQTLITQIEILSDIATSFSNFTALPELKPERLLIAEVLKQSLNLHNNPAEVHLTTDIQDGTFEVVADENILMRSFNNLMINALQAVPAGRQARIHVSLKAEGDKVLIAFRDNGSGIPAEIRHKIFVPNFSTKFTGSGIGLAVVKKGIESGGGRIWFETEEGEGTTFYIELPLAKE